MSCDVIIVNLTRLGDLLQSQPLIQDLHDSGKSVGLVCLENFAQVLPLLAHVDRAWTIPGARLMAETDRDWKLAATHVLSFARDIRKECSPKHVINLTATLSARLLSKMLAPIPDAVLGFAVDAEGYGVDKGFWPAFLLGTTLSRKSAVFNIVDMFRRTADPLISEEIHRRDGLFRLVRPDGKATSTAARLLREAARSDMPPARGYVAFQLGASNDMRRWPVAHFAALGDMLWNKAGLCPVLTGSAAEKSLGEKYAALAEHPHINVQGRTDLPTLGALLLKTRMLVTNDTGTMHLAAGLGIPSTAFFLATAQPWDTGPYLDDCLCLEPAMPCHPCEFGTACPNANACRRVISAEGVGRAILTRLSGMRWESGVGDALKREARIWTSCRKKGLAGLENLSGYEDDDRALWMLHQRLFWRQILDNDASPNRSMRIPPCSVHFQGTIIPPLEQAWRMLKAIGENAAIVGKNPLANNLFLRNCDRLQTLLHTTPALAGMSHLWRHVCSEMGGELAALQEFLSRFEKNLSVFIENIRNGTHCA